MRAGDGLTSRTPEGFDLKGSAGLLHIISHTDLDGVVAAAVAWRANACGGRPLRISLTGYGGVDNLILTTARAGMELVVLDLSPQFQPTVDEIDRLFSAEVPPFLFDHHKTAFEKYEKRPWAVVDVAYCGAMVYWRWLFDGNADEEVLRAVEPLREAVRVANDRDLWINEDPDGRLWQAMVTMCGEWGALSRLIANPDVTLSDAERSAALAFVECQEERFRRAGDALVRSRIDESGGEMVFLGDGHLEFGDTSDFCGMILDRPADPLKTPLLVALAYRKPDGSWAVSMRSRSGAAGKVVGLLKDGRKLRGGGHGDAAALYFPASYGEDSIRESIVAALSVDRESAAGMGVTLGDLLKGAR